MTYILAFARRPRRRSVGAIALAAALVVPGMVAAQGATARVATADTSSQLPIDPHVVTGRMPNGLRNFIRKNARPEKRAELRLTIHRVKS